MSSPNLQPDGTVTEPDRWSGYGLLLPSFGPHATREVLSRAVVLAEALGFRSVWVRDHVVFHPHAHEADHVDRTHLDPIATLAFLAGLSDRVWLGTAALIPHRHPIHLAGLLASLSRLAGPQRVIAGIGVGAYDHEFEAVGLGGVRRLGLLKENVDILRRLWRGEVVTHEGETYRFADVEIHPTPPGGGLPIWYCGGSAAAVRLAAERCDGWLPGRLPLQLMRKRIGQLQQLAGDAGRSVPPVGNIVVTSPAPTVRTALSAVNWRGLIEELRATYPTESLWDGPDEPGTLEGALAAGPPESISESILEMHSAGVDHVVFDLRFRFADLEACIQVLGEEVLPRLHDERRRPHAPQKGPDELDQR